MNDDGMRPLGGLLAKVRAMAQARGVDLDAPEEPAPVVSEHERIVEWFGDVWARQIPRKFQDARVGLVDGSVRDELSGWAVDDGPAGRNLVLLGPVGTGKTWAACAAARVWAYSRARQLRAGSAPLLVFAPVVELLDDMRPGGDDRLGRKATTARLLILDDLGAERATDWAAERLYGIVNRRWLDDLPTIVTTNVPVADLSAAVGDRILSRIVGGAVAVRMSGPDRRRS